MSALLASTATLLGRTVLSPVAPHRLFSVRVEHAQPGSSSSTKDSDNGAAAAAAAAAPTPASLISACPNLDPAQSAQFKPTPWLASGHLQTVYSAAASFAHVDPVTYKRRVFIVPDGGTIALDISPPKLADSEIELKETSPEAAEGVPTVVCLHGLTGGSHESYVRNCFSHLTKPKADGGCGFRGIVVNFRGLANVPCTSPQLYSASKTSDLRSALLMITKLYPNSPLVGIGFSLGANILAKYMGEQGEDTPLLAAIVVGTPFDLKAGSDALEYGGMLPQTYSKAMGSNLRRMVTRNKDTLALHEPFRKQIDELFDPIPITPEQVATHKRHCKQGGPAPGEPIISRPNTLRHADEVMTRFVGGHPAPYGKFPFNTADDYYTQGSCTNFIRNVKRPLLCLSAEDDPIVPPHIWNQVRAAIGYDSTGKPDPEAKDTNPNIVLAWTGAGGHLGWFQGIRPRRWLYKPVSEFISAVFSQATDEYMQRVRANSPWVQEGRVQTKEVDIELMPKEALPVYTLPDKAAASEPTASNEDADAEQELPEEEDLTPVAPHTSSRMGWLLTHVLPECPLVHPRHSACGRYSPPSTDAEQRGWETRRAQKMYTDSRFPEAGFCELDHTSRVAGAGTVFRGGIETPGEATEPGAKVIAGL